MNDDNVYRLVPDDDETLEPANGAVSTALAMLIVLADGAVRIAKVLGTIAIFLLAAVGAVDLLTLRGLPLLLPPWLGN